MIMTEMKVMNVGRDSYVPRGKTQGDMLLKLMDGSTVGLVEQFVNVVLTPEQVATLVPKFKMGVSVVGFRVTEKFREVFAGAPLKTGVVEFLSIDGKAIDSKAV
jgi:hypothetical protein